MRRTSVAIAVVAAFLSITASSSATRYASPGTSGACTQPDPCNVTTALSGASNGETVFIGPGTHNIPAFTSTGVSADDVVVVGVGRPTINFADGGFVVNGQEGSFSGFNITGTTTGASLLHDNSGAGDNVYDGLIVSNNTNTQTALIRPSSVIRNSVIVNSAVGGIGIILGGISINNTVLATGGTSYGIYTTSSYFATGPVAIVRNTYVRGSTSDLRAELGGAPDASIAVDHSNYRTGFVGGSGTITPGTGNQEGSALLDGNFSQLAGSPTIDAGIADPLTGSLDLGGGPRLTGAAPDIGADEFVPAVATPPGGDILKPVVSSLKAVKKKGKLKSFTFSCTEAGTATLKYERKKGKKFKSAGSQTKPVTAGKNTLKPKKLKKGKYRLKLTVKDAAGNVSSSKTLNFSTK